MIRSNIKNNTYKRLHNLLELEDNRIESLSVIMALISNAVRHAPTEAKIDDEVNKAIDEFVVKNFEFNEWDDAFYHVNK